MLTVHASMFETVQESPAASESLGDDLPPSSPTSFGSCGSNTPLLPGIVASPDLCASHTLVNVGILYPYNGDCSILLDSLYSYKLSLCRDSHKHTYLMGNCVCVRMGSQYDADSGVALRMS